jgi:hypothetical protein
MNKVVHPTSGINALFVNIGFASTYPFLVRDHLDLIWICIVRTSTLTDCPGHSSECLVRECCHSQS